MPITIKKTVELSVDLNKYFPSLSRRLRGEIESEIMALASGSPKRVQRVGADETVAGMNGHRIGLYSWNWTDTRELKVAHIRVTKPGLTQDVAKIVQARYKQGTTILHGDLKLIAMECYERLKMPPAKAVGRLSSLLNQMCQRGHFAP